MNENQALEHAKSMAFAGYSRKEVVDWIMTTGVDANQAESIATSAFRASGNSGGSAGSSSVGAEEDRGSEGIGSIIFGLIMIIAGVVITMSSNSVWYGLIIVGVITLFQGVAKRF